MRTGQYPQSVSEDESELGFRHLVVEGLFPGPSPAAVVVRILSPSDMLLKVFGLNGAITYSHQRWGYSKSTQTYEDIEWWPVSNPISAIEIPTFIQEFDFHAPDETYQGDIIGSAFKSSEID